MFLYHYSDSRLGNSLLTRRAQKTMSKEEIAKAETKAKDYHEPGSYVDHISLFIEPIPYRTLPSIFHNKHSFWRQGKTVFEHIVDTKDLPNDLIWSLVETPEMDEYSDQFDWANASSTERGNYIRQLEDELVKRGFTGKGVAALESKVKPYLGRTESFYKEARKKSDAEQTMKQYAAYVPHLMVYPPNGVISVHETRKIVLGKASVSLENRPGYVDW